MTKISHTAACLTLIATAALAHDGVKNPDVKARMDLMVEVAEATKTLSGMARGRTTFDPAEATTTLSMLREHAEAIPDAFETKATDPKSEALPVIWTDWDGFLAASATMADATDRTVTDRADLAPAVKAIGASCSACHRDYRLDVD